MEYLRTAGKRQFLVSDNVPRVVLGLIRVSISGDFLNAVYFYF